MDQPPTATHCLTSQLMQSIHGATNHRAPLFRLLFLPAICYLFYWIQADWTFTSSRDNNEAWIWLTTGNSRHTRSSSDESWLISHAFWPVVDVNFWTVCRRDTDCSSFLPNLYFWTKTGATGSGLVHRFVQGLGRGQRCRLNLLRVFVVFLSFARPIMEIKWCDGPFVLYYINQL